MTRQIFNQRLRQYLAVLPPEDVEKTLIYFNEMIDERIEEGMSEEEALADLGDVRLIADRILAEEKPLLDQFRDQIMPNKTVNGRNKLLIILGFPLWMTILLAVLLFCLSLYILYWIFWLVSGLFVFAGSIAILSSLYFLWFNLYKALFLAGGGFGLLGIGVLSFYGLTRLQPRVQEIVQRFRKRGLRT